MDCQANVQNGEAVKKLVTGIFDDAQELTRQQLALLRLEAEGRLSTAKTAAVLLACGTAFALLGGGLLSFMLVYVLSTLYPTFPLWACFGAVGAPVGFIGVLCVWLGIRNLKRMRAPFEQSKRAIQETMEWTTTRKGSVGI